MSRAYSARTNDIDAHLTLAVYGGTWKHRTRSRKSRSKRSEVRDVGQLRTSILESNEHVSAALMQDVLEKDVVEHLTSLSQSHVFPVFEYR